MKKNILEFLLQLCFVIGIASAYYIYNHNNIIFPCSSPITYKIGTIDPKFNLSKDDAIEYAKEAGNLWNKGTNQNLLEYNDKAQVEIDFVYDERQRTIIQNKILKEKVKDQEQVLSQKSQDIVVEKNNFLTLKNSYEQDVQAYNARLQIYNNNVLQVNNRGGATPDEAQVLNTEKEYLQNKGNELDTRKNELNDYLKNLNSQVENYNQITNGVNKVIGQINASSGQEFEEGNYFNNKITLYEYENVIDLKRLMAHELGHALGFEHTNDKNSIMHYLNLGEKFTLTQDDINEYKKVCGKMSE